MLIIISPFSQKLRNGNINAKNYPINYWKEVINILQGKGHTIIQIGVQGEEQLVPNCRFNLPMKELRTLLLAADTFISVDNFLPHMSSYLGKKGIVIWGPSDPKIFGHNLHLNLLKSWKVLRPNQFDIWEGVPYNEDSFPPPTYVIKALEEHFVTHQKTYKQTSLPL